MYVGNIVEYIIKGFIFPYRTTLIPKLYLSTTDTYTTKTSMPNPARQRYSSSSINNKMYANQGHTGGANINDLDEYTEGSNTWASKTNNPEIARYSSFATTDNYGYSVGGYANTYSSRISQYSQAGNTWTAKPNYSVALLAPSTIHNDNDKINCMGGNSAAQGETNQHKEYTQAGNAWAVKTNLVSGCRSSSPIRSKNDIVLIAGSGFVNQYAVYSVASNTWGSAIALDRISATFSDKNNKFYGGNGDGGYIVDISTGTKISKTATIADVGTSSTFR